MFESIKTQLWDLLKEKQVSLVMIFDKKGQILWNRGRKIEGKSIYLGTGFSKSLAKKIISQGDAVKRENVEVMMFGKDLTESARNLRVKTLLILPIKKGFFLYVDSGTSESFSRSDIEVFKTLGELLGKMIEKVIENGEERHGITGNSQAIKIIRKMVIKYSLEEEPILLIGETGVGKTHIAELIHRYSGRKGKFEVVEITSISENLFESTMFGHRKGSFTDAKSDKIGLVQEANNGTLFIEEISEIPTSFQAKLLRFIEKKKYRVLGESSEKEAEVRIVAASNRDLKKAINNREFREDLYYRLQVLEIEIPPLRERKEDIKIFVNQNRKYLKGKEIGEGFWEVILNYGWPGNMRELITVLKRAGILLNSPITGDEIKSIIYGKHHEKTSVIQDNTIQLIWKNFKNGKSFWDEVKIPFLNRDLNRNQVKAIINSVLIETNGNYKKTLKLLNINNNEYTKFMKFLYRNNLN